MLLDHFSKAASASPELRAKYSPLLPPSLTAVWEAYGFGTLLEGYLKLINPDEYQSLLNDTYALSGTAIPIFVTAFADIITWEKGRYLRMVNYKEGFFEGIAAGFNFFWEDLESGAFDSRFFQRELYRTAVRQQGPLAFDEGFGYTPLLALGGSRQADHLRKVKLKEHIALIAQTAGAIGTAR